MTGPTLDETDPRLLKVLADAGNEWGPLGVLRAAIQSWPQAADAAPPSDKVRDALFQADSILSLLRYRGIIDSPQNRADVKEALDKVRAVTDPLMRSDVAWVRTLTGDDYGKTTTVTHPGGAESRYAHQSAVLADEAERSREILRECPTCKSRDRFGPRPKATGLGGSLHECPDTWHRQADDLTFRHRTVSEQQNPDGSWGPAEPLGWQGPVAKVEGWLRAHNLFPRLADALGRWDERNLGK